MDYQYIYQWKRQLRAMHVFIGALALITIAAVFAFHDFFFLVGLLVVNALTSSKLKFIRRNQIGIEMVMFSTVISGVLYGPVVGAIMGALSMLIDYIFASRISMFSIVTIPSYMLIGVVAASFSAVPILTLGLTLTVLYLLFSNAIILGVMGGHLNKSLRFAITDLGFNAILFSLVAPVILAIL